MKEKITKQNIEQTDEPLQKVFTELSTPPSPEDVEVSFSEMLETVTSKDFARIPESTRVASPYMSYIKSLLTQVAKPAMVTVPALAVVLLVVYIALPKFDMSQYNDIVVAVLPDNNSLYDDLGDKPENLYNDLLTDDPTLNTEVTNKQGSSSDKPVVAISNSKQKNSDTTETPTSVVEAQPENIDALLAFNDIFTDNEVNDTELESWFADTSATDNVFEIYEI